MAPSSCYRSINEPALFDMIISKNDTARIVWLISICCLLLISFVIWAIVRDMELTIGPLVGVLALTIFGLLVVVHALQAPCTSASTLENGDIVFAWRYPHKRICKTFPAAMVEAPVVSKIRDSDGDLDFCARLRLPDGSDFILKQSILVTGSKSRDAQNRARCEKACAEFSKALDSLRAR